jgi:hypothetical protein
MIFGRKGEEQFASAIKEAGHEKGSEKISAEEKDRTDPVTRLA